MFYGWRVLLVAAAAMVGTLPGRTQGLGLITEPLIADLGLDRVTYAQLNFWATLIGAAGALGIGHAVDRFGSRRVLTLIAFLLGAIVCAMSATAGALGLAVWLTLTRAVGQSALSVVSLAIVGHWFVRRINVAMAIYSIVMSIGFMIAFPALGALVQVLGWRAAWFSVGAALSLVLAPLAWVVVRRNPESCGLVPDGDRGSSRGARDAAEDTLAGHTWQDAIRTPAFWVFASGTALYGLVGSGIGLFNESILAMQGFGPDVYYQTLVVTAMTALIGNFGGGYLAQRWSLTALLACSLGILAAGVAGLPYVDRMWQVMLWASAMGIGGGFVMVLFFSVWARVFGRRDLGRIQGAAQALTVVASAVGPLLLAWCVELTGSYTAMFHLLAALIGCVAVAGLVVALPAPPPVPSPVAPNPR